MMEILDSAISIDSTIVVIGANGYIAVEVCEKILRAGYRVRGTVRDTERNLWMQDFFDRQWPNNFELTRVVDFEVDDAFDDAFRGAAGVVYVSTPIVFDPSPTKAIDPVVKGTINTLEAAARADVKRYVLLSSSKAVESTVYNQPHTFQEVGI